MELSIKDKQKWQIALRRYIFDGVPCFEYAPFFALDTKSFKEWIGASFTKEMNWENFSTVWQLGHIISPSMINWKKKEELNICWHFTNIYAEPILDKKIKSLKQIKQFYILLGKESNLKQIKETILWLDKVGENEIKINKNQLSFLTKKDKELIEIGKLESVYLKQLNQGRVLSEITKEIEILEKYK